MKKILLLLLLPILCACDKDNNHTPIINAPLLPVQSLSWDMQHDDFDVTMQKAGYVYVSKLASHLFYMHITDNRAFWGARFGEDNRLYELTYYYCGDNLQLARSFWAIIVSPDKQSFNWEEICANPIYTSNTTIKLDEANRSSIEVGKVKYQSTLTARYSENLQNKFK